MRHLTPLLPLALLGTFSTPAADAQDFPLIEISAFEFAGATPEDPPVPGYLISWPFPSDGYHVQFSRSATADDWEYLSVGFLQQFEGDWAVGTTPFADRFFFRMQDYFADLLTRQPDLEITASGLHRERTQEGTGATPTASDTVVVHYEGRFPNGQIFDSSYQRGTPATFPVGGVIDGFAEGILLLQEGGKLTAHLPSAIAYGAQGTPSIPPYQILIFDIELIEVQ